MLLLSIFASIFIFNACGKSEQGGVTKEGSNEKKYTVTFFDMDKKTELSKQEVKAGELIEEYTPEKDNYVFMGWFATPSLAHKFDFSTPIASDTEIFAGFLEDKEDTRSFAIVGSGKSPILVASNWGAVIEDEHILAKEENTYSITLDLFEGDEFQFAINTSWFNQRGAGYLTTTSQDDVEYFAGASSDFQDEAKRANIKCLKSGNYTLKLTTYPGADVYDTEDSNYTEETKENFDSNPYDTIEWTYNGEPKEEIEAGSTTYYIKSSIATNWEDIYEDKYKMKETDDSCELTISLEEKEEFLFTSMVNAGGSESVGNEYVKFSNIKDKKSLEVVEGSASDNIIAKEAGTYTFIYNPETKELSVTFKK